VTEYQICNLNHSFTQSWIVKSRSWQTVYLKVAYSMKSYQVDASSVQTKILVCYSSLDIRWIYFTHLLTDSVCNYFNYTTYTISISSECTLSFSNHNSKSSRLKLIQERRDQGKSFVILHCYTEIYRIYYDSNLISSLLYILQSFVSKFSKSDQHHFIPK
jgi:hypothetical protein